ncbi:Hypothetical protein R9X50_00366400 [Acrodontium crateriforme]|uniref:ARM repeat superfamily protein n=1 Tax=Acrodontium crateriforme TaxID=150365 RepID=A0AAQ3M3V1_9PEZI|nr:Hypothetical protein R9X50_00366400 [Acrodontium crateriforme]
MSGVNAPVAAPTNIEEVEQLVKRLYQPNSPKIIQEINNQLQHLQLSSDGWQMADTLLGSNDSTVRFFGALTFQVKLNNDGPSLDHSTAQTVLTRLVFWLVQVSHDRDAMVCRKLCSALTTYFLRSPFIWKRPLQHLAMSLQNGNAVVEAPVENSSTDISMILRDLDSYQIITLLWFSSTLADEVGKVDPNTAANAQMHTLMETIVRNASALMQHAFTNQGGEETNSASSEALKCFLNWVNYAQPVWQKKPEGLEVLRALIEPAAHCLTIPDLQRHSLDVFRDLLESYTTFFQPEHLHLLAQIIDTYIQPVLLQGLQDKDPEVLPYGQMVIALGVATVTQVVEEPTNQYGSINMVKLQFEILKAPGYPGDDDELSIQAIEFWNTYIEHLNDQIFSSDHDVELPPYLDHSKAVLTQVVELLWAKMVIPPNDVSKDWGSDQSDGFKDFRLDASDLMLSICVCLGQSMLKQFIDMTLQSLHSKQWRNLEAALFCLNILSENIIENQSSTVEDGIRPIFSSSLFREVGDFSQSMPAQTRRTAIDMLGSYGQYVERHAEYLPDALRFLFASLETSLCNSAAKSISSLCSTCRVSLTSELPGFLDQYKRFLKSPTSDSYTKEKVIYAIACIVQALNPESAKVQPLHALLENIENDIQAAKEYNDAGEAGMVEVLGITALKCLTSIGKGLQVPEDVVINIYEEDEGVDVARDRFWQSGEGQAIQERIMGCFSVLQIVGAHGDAIEAACDVLRTGFAETEPGPFVLPPTVTVSFMQQCTLRTPQLETVLSTACTLITQHSRQNSVQIDAEATAICQQAVLFMQQLGNPSLDPGVAQSCIDVFGRLQDRYTHIFIDEASPIATDLPSVLNFMLQAIEGVEPFPKRAALQVWTRLIKPTTNKISDSIRERSAQIVVAYGPQLTGALIRQIAGMAWRSELDYICEPLKALVMNQPATKLWLEAAMTNDSFPCVHEAVDDAAKRRFIQQIMGLRGDLRKMRDVTKEFYAACRGTVLSYNRS